MTTTKEAREALKAIGGYRVSSHPASATWSQTSEFDTISAALDRLEELEGAHAEHRTYAPRVAKEFEEYKTMATAERDALRVENQKAWNACDAAESERDALRAENARLQDALLHRLALGPASWCEPPPEEVALLGDALERSKASVRAALSASPPAPIRSVELDMWKGPGWDRVKATTERLAAEDSPPAPTKECEHDWTWDGGSGYRCPACGEFSRVPR